MEQPTTLKDFKPITKFELKKMPQWHALYMYEERGIYRGAWVLISLN